MLFGTAVLLSGCDLLEKWDAEKAVTGKLRDPSSAQFRNARIVDDQVICGEVNAKNAFGGYVGFEPYAVTRGERGDQTVYLAAEGDRQRVNILCGYSKVTAPAPAVIQDLTPGAVAWNVQVASLTSDSEAFALVEKLKSSGSPAFSTKAEGMNRVFAGPYGERNEADKAKDWLLGEFRLNGFVVRAK